MSIRFSAVFRTFVLMSLLILLLPSAGAQSQSNSNETEHLKNLVTDLQTRVTLLEQKNEELTNQQSVRGLSGPDAAVALARASMELKRNVPRPL